MDSHQSPFTTLWEKTTFSTASSIRICQLASWVYPMPRPYSAWKMWLIWKTWLFAIHLTSRLRRLLKKDLTSIISGGWLKMNPWTKLSATMISTSTLTNALHSAIQVVLPEFPREQCLPKKIYCHLWLDSLYAWKSWVETLRMKCICRSFPCRTSTSAL